MTNKNDHNYPYQYPILILNNRDIIQDVPQWFTNSIQTVAVITSAAAVKHLDLSLLKQQFLYFEVAESYETPFIENAVRRFHQRFGISKLLTISERDIIRAAYLRQELNIKGQSVESANAYRNKFDMKSRAAQNNVQVARMRAITDMTSMREVMETIEFPMIIKRIDGAAAIDMAFVKESDELAAFYHNKLGSTQSYLAETFVYGHNYHVDGIMKDGAVIHSWPSRYLYTQWQTMYQALPNISAMLPQNHELFYPLQSCAARTVESLPPPPGYSSFHAEFFNPSGTDIVLGEIACRPGGAGIVPTYESAFGINLQKVTLKGQAGLQEETVVMQPDALYGWASFPPNKGTLRRYPTSCDFDFVKYFSQSGKLGKHYQGPGFVTENIAEMRFLADQENPLTTLNLLAEWFSENCEWEASNF